MTEQQHNEIRLLIKQKRTRAESIRGKGSSATREQLKFVQEELHFLALVEKLLSSSREINLGKLPPQALDLEETLLGALMLEGNTVGRVSDILEPRHFSLPAHAVIYETILVLASAGVTGDMRLVVAQLRKAGKLEIVGGAYYIAGITSKVSSSANVEYYARIIIEHWLRRETIRINAETIHAAYDDTTDVFEVIEHHMKQQKEILPEPVLHG